MSGTETHIKWKVCDDSLIRYDSEDMNKTESICVSAQTFFNHTKWQQTCSVL